MRPFTLEELEKGISSLKPGKSVGLDKIATEQVKHFDLGAKKWLLSLYKNCMNGNL